MRSLLLNVSCAAVLVGLTALTTCATPQVEQLAPHLYAYVSDNNHSSNSTFLVGQHGILVVDTGLNTVEAQKLLAEIRKISPLPVQFVINTHYHLDHQGGNGIIGPDATIISTPYTRERTLQWMAQGTRGASSAPPPSFRAASITVVDRLTLWLDDSAVEIIAPGPGHTMGDLYVFFPKQRTVSTGDLYLTNSCPAMDQGSAQNWVRSLDAMLSLAADHYVAGHFEVGTRADITRFRDYMSELVTQVTSLYRSGVPIDQVPGRLDMKHYQDFRQLPQFHATFADNAQSVYRQLQQLQGP
jgi:cyclase